MTEMTETRMDHPHYAFRHGSVCMVIPRKPLSKAMEDVSGDENVHPVERALSLVIDAESGSILHHGSEDLVAPKWTKVQKMTRTFPDLWDLRLVTIPAHEISAEMLDEINACIGCTGRAKGLATRLAAMTPASRHGACAP